ncbi:cytochrome P450 [Flagelloscypha sp. PMI_526]|nr:cytochrome P450 [Flagelloscypha sp. PMI_526]
MSLSNLRLAPSSVIIVTSIATLSYLFNWWTKRSRYPPGPIPLPLLGNALDLDPVKPWKSFITFGTRFNSPVVHISVLGMNIVAINDYDFAREVLNKRGYRNASRPPMYMVHHALGARPLFSVNSPDSPHWKECRKESELLLRPSSNGSKSLREVQLRRTRECLEKIKHSPEKFRDHCNELTSGFSLEIAYGVAAQESHDYLVDLADRTFRAMSLSTRHPLVDAIPLLRYLPSWLPGMQWKIDSIEWRRNTSDMINVPFDMAVKHFEQSNTEGSSITDQLLKRKNEGEAISDDMIKSLTVTIVSGGSDTSKSAITSFILCMMNFPDIQVIARTQVDSVVGRDRLPTFEDRAKLPYVEAIIYEVLRFVAPIPLALPHYSTEDDIWQHGEKEYFVPKGTVILPNIWAMTRDPQTYPKPGTFNPSRFLNQDGTLNHSILPEMIYGIQTKALSMSPQQGKWVAEDVVFIFAATFLSQFQVKGVEGTNVRDWVSEDFDDMWESGMGR